jgi:hypothetical protein
MLTTPRETRNGALPVAEVADLDVEKPEPGSVEMQTIQAELGARATELLLLRDYAQRLGAAFDRQALVVAGLRAEVERLRGTA